MKKIMIIMTGWIFIWSSMASAGNLFVVADGTGECKDNAFIGKVPDAALITSSGKTIEVIEVIDRYGEGKGADKRFKTKRLLITPDGAASAMAYSADGKCANVKTPAQLTEAEIAKNLLNPGEKLTAFNAQAMKGDHGTVATYIITQ